MSGKRGRGGEGGGNEKEEEGKGGKEKGRKERKGGEEIRSEEGRRKEGAGKGGKGGVGREGEERAKHPACVATVREGTKDSPGEGIWSLYGLGDQKGRRWRWLLPPPGPPFLRGPHGSLHPLQGFGENSFSARPSWATLTLTP